MNTSTPVIAAVFTACAAASAADEAQTQARGLRPEPAGPCGEPAGVAARSGAAAQQAEPEWAEAGRPAADKGIDSASRR